MPSSVTLVDAQTPPLLALCQQLRGEADLSDTLVLIPDISESSSLRKRLLKQRGEHTGVLLPQINSLRSWLESNISNNRKIINNHARELMLIDVLQHAQTIKGRGSAWQLADELLKLFDELELSGHDCESLVSGLLGTGSQIFLEDADKVSRLWKARSEQMEAEDVTDRVQLYSRALDSPPPRHRAKRIFLCGYDWLQGKELAWIRRFWSDLSITVLTTDTSPLARQLAELDLSPDPRASYTFLDTCFATSPDLLSRARHWKASNNSAPLKHCEHYVAATPEHEARLIDAQIRDWIHKGKQNIGLITEDRQLARRVSAMLQNAELRIHDDAGWPLSTTVAAGALERWLECVENDFPQRALLDVLKSPFTYIANTDQQDIFRFERDIVQHEKIATGIDRYSQAIKDRGLRLGFNSDEYQNRLETLIDTLRSALKPLTLMIKGGQYRPTQLLQGLKSSLTVLGLYDSYKRDAAGMRLLQELEDMGQCEQDRDIRFSWPEFRQWLRRALETHNFRPAREPGPVRIISLQQSLTGEYDGVILAGLDDTKLPRPAARLIFFNDQVKNQLGLPSWTQSRDRQLFQFRRLLEQTPSVLMTHSSTNDNTPKLPSPWLARINSFLQATTGNTIAHPILALQADLLALQLRSKNDAKAPQITEMPSPNPAKEQLPKRWSATGHQQLIDCPYRFFVSYILGLRAPDEIIEQMSYREYGEKAHLCLQAFHSDVDGLPGPFLYTLNDENREAALELLLELGQHVFRPDGETDVRHRNWYRMWAAMAPLYLFWQQTWQTDWTVMSTEWSSEVALTEATSLNGKLDRVDHGPRGQAVIDYKSGAINSRQADMLCGEDVQLATYALLLTKPQSVAYLSLKASAENGKRTATLEDEILQEIVFKTKKRLIELAECLESGSPMPANGDENACRYCPSEGLCRKETWDGAA